MTTTSGVRVTNLQRRRQQLRGLFFAIVIAIGVACRRLIDVRSVSLLQNPISSSASFSITNGTRPSSVRAIRHATNGTTRNSSAVAVANENENENENDNDGANGREDMRVTTKDLLKKSEENNADNNSNNTSRSNNECPLVFGLGHQKSGTSTIVKALGSISNVTARIDVPPFWKATPMSDENVLKSIHRKKGLIQKEGHAVEYVQQLARICPDMRYYVIRRDALTTVRSMADRLRITSSSNCTAIDWIPGGWQPLFRHSNSTSCLVRMAASVLDYEKRVKEFAKDHSVKEIAYEDYLKDRVGSIRGLCRSLEVLGPCDGTILDDRQYQGVGSNRDKNLSDIWPASILMELEEMVASSEFSEPQK
eukprot:scaffold182046_cov43-Attheya_sp.AAC.1